MIPRRAFPVLVVTAALLVGCSSESAAPPPPGGNGRGTTTTTGPPRVDLDPERYVLDYASPDRDETYSSGSPTASAPDASSSGGDVAEEPAPPYVPTIHEGNTFVDPGEHPFVSAEDEASSTFGLDVDTGSLSVGRTFLTAGTLPPSASVRTEEWVNALGSAQDGPTGGSVGITVDGSPNLAADGTTSLVRVGVAARDLTAEDRPPANITFVVDTSGSMDIRERLGLVKASLGLLVLNLRDDDTIAIVEYSDEAGVILEPTPVRDAERIVDAIDELQPSNSTNLEAGLRAGYEQAADAFRPDGLNAVVLASDGVANVGLTDPDGLAGVIQDRAAEGIHLVTVGYGMGNYNDDLMEQIADQGDGFYAYLDTYEQAERLFRDRLTSTLAVVADDAKAQVTFDPTYVSEYRLIGYENRALETEDFDDETVDAGELGAGHRVTALYEVSLPDFDQEPPADAEIAMAAVRYRDEQTGETVTVQDAVTWADVRTPEAEVPADLRLQRAGAAFAEWLADQPTAPGYEDPDDGTGYDDEAAPRTAIPPVDVGDRADRLAAIRAAVADAAADLPADGLAGSVVTPDELLELIDLAADAAPSPTPYPYED